MRSTLLLVAVGILSLGCQTVGVSRDGRGFAEVKPTVAHEMLLDERQIVVLDFRPTSEYWEPLGHIAGALSTPLDSIELRLPELMPYQNTTILVYADAEDDAIRGARVLLAAGFRNIVVIQGGIRRWIELGYKTVSVP